MNLAVFDDRLRGYGDAQAFWANNRTVSFNEFMKIVDDFKSMLEVNAVPEFSPVLLIGDIEPESVALLWACISRRLICIPHLAGNIAAQESKILVAEPEWILSGGLDAEGNSELSITKRPHKAERQKLFNTLASKKVPGLVLFTSGTTGEPKAAVHDFSLLLEKFKTLGKSFRTVAFLLFDHWGGLNTIFHTLLNGGCIICVENRKPMHVCRAAAEAKAELLPVSPSFLNILLASEAYKHFDLSSLKLMTYGAEPMPPQTLEAVRKTFPGLRLKQTYGLIELGVFPTRAREDDSLFFKIDRTCADYRIVDGMLQIKTASAMLGYLNAPSPFTDDNWYITGDEVEVDGEFIRVIGRRSNIINVGGEKVYPAEVENVLLGINDVSDVRVYGEKNFLMGNIVCADLHCKNGVDTTQFEFYVKKECAKKLEPFKVPVKIKFFDAPFIGDRLKKVGV